MPQHPHQSTPQDCICYNRGIETMRVTRYRVRLLRIGEVEQWRFTPTKRKIRMDALKRSVKALVVSATVFDSGGGDRPSRPHREYV